MKFLSSKTSLLLSLTLAGVAFAACDLPQKDIGDESDTASDTNGDGCSPGDEMPAPDGCNTCVCGDDGFWACTEIGCDPTAGSDSGGSDTVGGECEDGTTMPAPDGCNECYCENGMWACTLMGCPDTDGGDTDGDTTDPFSNNGIHVCDDSVPFDPLVVNGATIEGNNLVVDLAYSGGCQVHLFGGCWDGYFLESEPVQVQLRIAHDSMMDACEAFPQEQHTFDLASLAEAYMDGYQTDSGTIEISLEGFQGPLEYNF